MDHRSDLNRSSSTCVSAGSGASAPAASRTATSPAATVDVDQAVFTSIRTPMGQGYRIVAAGRGVSREERAWITQRAPSHGSMDRSAPDAMGLLAWPLDSGRYCVGHVQHAGKEHTGRGGQRVYTLFALIDGRDFQRFACNPVRVLRAVRDAAGETPQLKPPPQLPRLTLACTAHGRSTDTHASPLPVAEAVAHVARAMLHEESCLVIGAPDPIGLIDRTIAALPVSVRTGLSVSAGLTYAPSRRVRLSVARAEPAEAQRAVRGQEIHWLDIARPPSRAPSPYDAWLDLAVAWWAAGRQGDLAELTDLMTDTASPEFLERVAAMGRDLDAITGATDSTRASLESRYAAWTSPHACEELLLSRIRRELNHRLL